MCITGAFCWWLCVNSRLRTKKALNCGQKIFFTRCSSLSTRATHSFYLRGAGAHGSAGHGQHFCGRCTWMVGFTFPNTQSLARLFFFSLHFSLHFLACTAADATKTTTSVKNIFNSENFIWKCVNVYVSCWTSQRNAFSSNICARLTSLVRASK